MGFSYRLRAWLFAFLIYAAMAVIGIAGGDSCGHLAQMGV